MTGTNCVDKHDTSKCSYWAKKGECEKNAAWMIPNCKLSCGECIPRMAMDPIGCREENKNCPGWAARGECKKNPSYMLIHCRKSCNECDTCQDDNDNCAGWAKIGECEKNPYYMNVHCQRSCGMCENKMAAVSDPVFADEKCDDDNVHCKDWADKGECTKNPHFMEVACSETCHTCNCTDNNASCGTWSRAGQCASNNWMHINCRKSCHLCCEGEEEDDSCCKDKDPRCAKWAEESEKCTKGETPFELQNVCPHSCGQC